MSTPMMIQYNEIKSRYSDCILFYRMGDFYELFGDDAIVSSKVLGITLTRRNNGKSGQTPLCGFPHHSAERYVPKMVNAGYKVAICEQIEDPKEAKGIVKRDVIEVITAGTTLNESTLDASTNTYLCAILPNSTLSEEHCALAILDISTGEFQVTEGDFAQIESELYRLSPREVLVPAMENDLLEFVETISQQEKLCITPLIDIWYESEGAHSSLLKQFKTDSLDAYGLEGRELCIRASGAVLQYALDQKKTNLDHLDRIQWRSLGDSMNLDPQTLRNLELIKPLNADDPKSTLVHVLDHTVTAMGARKLKRWISHPLLSVNQIHQRHDAIDELLSNPIFVDDIKVELREIMDIERLIGRLGSGRANARDLIALGKSLAQSSRVAILIKNSKNDFFKSLQLNEQRLSELGQNLLSYFTDEPPITLREGKLIRENASKELDELNLGIKDARIWLSGLEAREKERTGIPTLKIGFNKVFGYYLEVTSQHHEKVPAEYIRKQTLANAERFISPEMKEYETQILNAEGEINTLEYKLFSAKRDEAAQWCSELRNVADQIAKLDSILSLSIAAARENYTRPSMEDSATLEIFGGFHPVIKASNPEMQFITNDVQMNPISQQIMLITGPNMAGKSTYLRQTGLIVLMAQIGSFVPASSARIGIVDRIFTRVGASDRLARGQSTFMVEMVETANILHNASDKSLILLDEIGRGTSTFDGLALAWAIIEDLHNDPKRAGKTLFATHYHELTVLDNQLERLANFHITVKEYQGKLVFLRKIIEGACDSSYGIQVAEMAGLPKEVIFRAKRILHRLESGQKEVSVIEEIKPETQQDLFSGPSLTEDEIMAIDEIKRKDFNTLSPMDALSFLADLKSQYFK
tara:strand:- start:2578 stop:5187 length:2610 start_codon:yes stop_codon:yes gene_type:complete